MTLREYIDRLRGRTVAVIGIGVSNTPLLLSLIHICLPAVLHDYTRNAKALQYREKAGKMELLYKRRWNCKRISAAFVKTIRIICGNFTVPARKSR